MKNEIFYQNLNSNKSLIQRLASKMSNDFATSRFLFFETAHQAIKNKEKIKEENFHDWLIVTMKNINKGLLKNPIQVSN